MVAQSTALWPDNKIMGLALTYCLSLHYQTKNTPRLRFVQAMTATKSQQKKRGLETEQESKQEKCKLKNEVEKEKKSIAMLAPYTL